MAEGNKTIWYIAAGAAALVGGALLYHSLQGEGMGGDGGGLDKMFEEIGALGGVKRDPNGMMSFHYYKELFIIVNKYTKEKNAPAKKQLVDERRQALQNKDIETYKNLVKDILMKEEQGFGEVMQEAMEFLGLGEQEFMQVHQMYSQHPSFQQTMMQAQFQQTGEPSIPKEKAKRIFLASEEKKMDQMKKMMQKPNNSGDPMEAMMDVMIESCKLNDEMFAEHGIEEEEFNGAVMYYKLHEDPDVRALVMKSMQAMGMNQGGGGAPGMFGR